MASSINPGGLDLVISPYHPERILGSQESSLYYGLGGGVGLFLTQDLPSGTKTLFLKMPHKK